MRRFATSIGRSSALVAIVVAFACSETRSAHSPRAIESDIRPEGMVWIDGGETRIGDDRFYPEEKPVRTVRVDGFWIDDHEVTNAEFSAFTSATGYVTLAEKAPTTDEFPDADPETLTAGSGVFRRLSRDEPAESLSWWRWGPGATWRQPLGPESTIEDRLNHPVVHVAFADAMAYARWADKDLPTEPEWERAARGGLSGAVFPWGDDLKPNGRYAANTWQGEFPFEDGGVDGFIGTSPVRSYPANGYGLFDVAGNVWEWTKDTGTPDPATIADARNGSQRFGVLKGGSFLCADNYCKRYRPAARLVNPDDTTTNHIGFRCVRRR